MRICSALDGFRLCNALGADTFRFLLHIVAHGFRLCAPCRGLLLHLILVRFRFNAEGFRLLRDLVFLSVRFALARDQLRFRFFFCLILHRVRLFADLCVQLSFLQGDLAIG